MLKIAVLVAVFVGAFCDSNKDPNSYGLIGPSSARFSRKLILAGGYDGYMEHDQFWSYPLFDPPAEEGDASWVEQNVELPKMYNRRSFHTTNVFQDYSFTFGGNSSRLELQQLINGKDHIFYEGNGPHPRVGHSATIRNQELYIYGGYDLVHEKFSDHFWMANLTDGYIHWNLLDIEGAPGARGGHSSILYQESLYIFGGQNEEGFFNDVWRYDFITGVWVRAWVWDEVSEHPFGRVGHVGTFWNDETYVIFGGYGTDENGNTRFLNDMWAFNLQIGVWKKLFEGTKAGFVDYDIATPTPRAFAAHTIIDGKLVLIGGQTSTAGYTRKVWNPYMRWTEIEYPEDFAADAWYYDFYEHQWHFIKCIHAFVDKEFTNDPRECKHNNQPTCDNDCNGHGVCIKDHVCQCRGEWTSSSGLGDSCDKNDCANGFAGYDIELLDRILISEGILNLGQKLAALRTKLQYLQEYLPEFEDFVTVVRSAPTFGQIFDSPDPASAVPFNHDLSQMVPVLEEFNEVLQMDPNSFSQPSILANNPSSFSFPNVVLSSDEDVAYDQ